jgi:hypothetical protein
LHYLFICCSIIQSLNDKGGSHFLRTVTCINEQADDCEAIQALIFRVSVNCPPTFDMNFERTQAKLLSGIESEIKVDEQISVRMNPLTLEVFKVNQNLQKIEKLVAAFEEELKNLLVLNQ